MYVATSTQHTHTCMHFFHFKNRSIYFCIAKSKWHTCNSQQWYDICALGVIFHCIYIYIYIYICIYNLTSRQWKHPPCLHALWTAHLHGYEQRSMKHLKMLVIHRINNILHALSNVVIKNNCAIRRQASFPCLCYPITAVSSNPHRMAKYSKHLSLKYKRGWDWGGPEFGIQ